MTEKDRRKFKETPLFNDAEKAAERGQLSSQEFKKTTGAAILARTLRKLFGVADRGNLTNSQINTAEAEARAEVGHRLGKRRRLIDKLLGKE